MPRRYRRYLDRAGGNVDMCHECLLHGTFYEEYRLYDFAHKTGQQRREYITDAVRDKICRRINGRKGTKIIANKYATYQIMKDYYHRQAWLLANSCDIDAIATEGMRRGKLVVKPCGKCGGRGVEKLQFGTLAEWRKALAEALKTHGECIAEELIVQDAAMAQWNADSVNTIRMSTLYRNGTVVHYTPFLLVGQKGSFVNNGAQGGMFASINPADGIIVTDLFDECGHRLKCHPDSGIVARGFAIPQWDSLLQTTAEMARKMPDMTYIGWDMALSDKGWVCVEANKGEFVAQQVTLQRGLRKELESLL